MPILTCSIYCTLYTFPHQRFDAIGGFCPALWKPPLSVYRTCTVSNLNICKKKCATNLANKNKQKISDIMLPNVHQQLDAICAFCPALWKISFIQLALRPDLTFVNITKLNWFELCTFAFHIFAHHTRSCICR